MTQDEIQAKFEEWEKQKNKMSGNQSDQPETVQKPQPHQANGHADAVAIEDTTQAFDLPSGQRITVELYEFCMACEAAKNRLDAANREARHAYHDALDEAQAKGEKPELVPLPREYTYHDWLDEVVKLIQDDNPGVVVSRGVAEKVFFQANEIYLQKKSEANATIQRLLKSLNSTG